MKQDKTTQYDVIIVGAGPTGLTLANYLGSFNIRTLVLEQLSEIISYPRGVALDDEALRSFQAIELADQVGQHTTPDHSLRFVKPNGHVLARVEPSERPYGWPRRNAFNQPLVDKELFDGLSRFDCVEIQFGATVTGVSQTAEQAVVEVEINGAAPKRITAKYLVGCDGGKSLVRESLSVSFEGRTSATKFVVIDVRNDPLGRPNAELILHPKRPFVNIALPSGIRRFEFSVADDEMAGETEISDDAMREKLREIFDDDAIDKLDIIRQRVYTHHGRICSSFRDERILLAGDAAHLMPVWQGQGFNTGIRDATNLGWKLAAVINGTSDPDLLDTYDSERRPHSKQMIDMSVFLGKVFSPATIFGRLARDAFFAVSQRLPTLRAYVTTMRWKPMPRFDEGVVVPKAGADQKQNIVGMLFQQPTLSDEDGERRKLDDFIGVNYAIVAWGTDPTRYIANETLARWTAIGGKIISIYPEIQKPVVQQLGIKSKALFDPDGACRKFFSNQADSVFLIRPDRVVGASCHAVTSDAAILALLDSASVKESIDAGARASVPNTA